MNFKELYKNKANDIVEAVFFGIDLLARFIGYIVLIVLLSKLG